MTRFILAAALGVASLCLVPAAWGQDQNDAPRQNAFFGRVGPRLYSVPDPAPAPVPPAQMGRLQSESRLPEPPQRARIVETRTTYKPFDPTEYPFIAPQFRSPAETLPGEARLGPFSSTRSRLFDPYAYVGGTAPHVYPPANTIWGTLR